MSTVTATKRPDAYVADNGNGTFDAFVKGQGFRANATLAEAIADPNAWAFHAGGGAGIHSREHRQI